MTAASSRVVLLVIAAAAALYIWRKSPHGALAAVLFAASIGIADLVSVRLVKPAVAPVRRRARAREAPAGLWIGRVVSLRARGRYCRRGGRALLGGAEAVAGRPRARPSGGNLARLSRRPLAHRRVGRVGARRRFGSGVGPGGPPPPRVRLSA